MNLVSREKIKKRSFTRFINSFKYSFQGLKYAYKYEQSMTIHVITALLVITMGVLFKINIYEWLICFMLFGLVMATELLNTSIEAVVDLVSPEKHPLAKIAKDTASAAVLSLCVVAFIGGLCIFIPKIWGLFF